MLASKSEIFVELVKPMTQNNALLTSFCDGIQWKEHELQGLNIILLRLYGDDVEPKDPLGSHKTLYIV